MSHIRVLICRVDDPNSDTIAKLAALDLLAPDVTALQPETALDEVEATTHTTGTTSLRRVRQAAWDLVDAELTARYRQVCPPCGRRRRRAMTRAPLPAASAPSP